MVFPKFTPFFAASSSYYYPHHTPVSSSSPIPTTTTTTNFSTYSIIQGIEKDQEMVNITLDQIISALASVPFVGRRLVASAINRSTQRHKCDTCGDTPEVNVGDIARHPLALLSSKGFQLHGHGLKTSEHKPDHDGKIVPTLGQSSVPASPTQAAPPKPSEEPSSTAADERRPRFTCQKCPNGRLGIFTFPGDSTDGSKELLVARIKKVFKAMPDLVQGQLTPESVDAFDVSDVYWVD